MQQRNLTATTSVQQATVSRNTLILIMASKSKSSAR